MSKKTLFNSNWLFKEFPLDTSYDFMNSSTLDPVELPHDWMIFHVNDLYKDSIGFYKKSFSLKPVSSHHYFLFFEGVYMDCHIYVNDNDVFEWKYGYSSFDVDITDYLIDGNNTVCVTCNYISPNTRWYSGAGIYRNVYFIEKDDVYFNNFGAYISTEKTGNDYKVFSDFEITSYTDSPFSVLTELINKDNNSIVASYKETLCSTGTVINKQSMLVSSPRVWDITDPYLYLLRSSLLVGEEIKDTYTCNLGFRTIRFDPDKGFFLNDRNVKINGVCMHHDLGSLGSAMNEVALKRQLKKMMDMGVNSIRTSHNMPSVELMNLADSMGLLIYTESFDMWELSKTPHDYANFFPLWWKKDVTNWVKRDCNHPSLIMWGIGNEIYDTHAGNGLKWTKLLRDAVRDLDYRHNAYITIGSNYIEWDNAQKCSDELELSGYNYGKKLYDLHHKKYPHWCIFGSETASTVQSRGIYHFPFESVLLTALDGQCSSLGNCTTNWGDKDVDSVVAYHRDKDFVFGQYLWSGWDYIGEPTPYFSKNSFFGQVDTAGFEKDTYYHYQAEWTDYKVSPMVHLLPYWDFNDGQIIDVCAYSNAPYVELFLNDVSQGKQFIDHLHGEKLQGRWKVPYKSGEIKVLAYDSDGNIVASDSHHSFGDSKTIVLNSDKNTLSADGKDLCFVEISTTDIDGFPVENARDRVTVSVSGSARLVGLDNGDSTDYEEYKGTSRKLFSGKLLAIIQSTYEAGEAVITVSSPYLESGKMIINTIPAACEKESGFFASNSESPLTTDIPVRKINLFRKGSSELTSENPDSTVEFEILPKNASFFDISFRALTKDGIDANFVKIETSSDKAFIHAFGDGEFRLSAFANNGKDYPEVISELEFSSTGMGIASLNPYELIPGINYFKSHSDECKLSFNGGVFLPPCRDGKTFVTYHNVDFGDYGSDEITIPIFSFKDEVCLEVWEGTIESGECLYSGKYVAKSIYNTYQANTFTLSRRISGTKDITLIFDVDDRISVHGFVFKKYNKSYSVINATEYNSISGDSFNVCKNSICNIGNNVTIEYNNMHFDEGVSGVRIVGKSNKPVSAVHILFKKETSDTRQMVEIHQTENIDEFFLPLNDIENCNSISFVFLPGSDFDLKEFQFKKRDA